LFARHVGGTFILRIEDTDVARSTEEYLAAILESLRWLGLDWDEGPYFQRERMYLYQEHAQRLLAEGKAYRCYCTPIELEERRKKALAEGRKPKYDGRCRDRKDAPGGMPYAIRFMSSDEGVTEVHDLVKGDVSFNNEELDDLIILRSDGVPTYNFVVVVDDALMRITHVIRGDDHLTNTPRQIQIYEALGYPIPLFAHVPLILGPDRTRLSKRHGATSVTAYQEAGYLPEALVNYLARLGWSFGDQEVFSRQELVKKFSLENVGKSAGIFNSEKLLWLNAHYLKETEPREIGRQLLPFLARLGVEDLPEEEYTTKTVETLQPRARTLAEMAESGLFYFTDDFEYEPKGAQKYLGRDILPFMLELAAFLERMDLLNKDELEERFRALTEQHTIKLKDAAQAVRIALTGKTVSPGLFEVMEILGKERVVARLGRSLHYIQSRDEGTPGQ